MHAEEKKEKKEKKHKKEKKEDAVHRTASKE